MLSWSSVENRAAIVRLNAELRHAQLELLSAQCAIDRLRLGYSADDIARFAQPDVLRRALQASKTLYEYYLSIDKRRLQSPPPVTLGATNTDEDFLIGAIAQVANYLQSQRDRFFPLGKPVADELRAAMHPFFSPALLGRVTTLELAGNRLAKPSFYDEASQLGFVNLPEITHMPSLTFIDVVVFNDKINSRALFHGLVHAVQFQVLGVERYTELFVRSFVTKKSHFNVPLEAHAIELEAKFAARRTFSVEEQIRVWIDQGRYSG